MENPTVYIAGQTIQKSEELVSKGGQVIGTGNFWELQRSWSQFDGDVVVHLVIIHYTEYLACVISNWRRKWQPIPLFLPGKSHGQRNLAGYRPRGRKESDMTEKLDNNNNFKYKKFKKPTGLPRQYSA